MHHVHLSQHHHITQRGTSLLETLITGSIVAVMVSIAIPSFAALRNKTEASSIVRHLGSGLMLARQAAVMQNTNVVVCPAAANGCGKNWENGLLIFSDHNNDRLINDNDRVMLRDDAELKGGSLSLHAFGNRRYLVFLPDGTLQNYTAGNFLYCPANRDTHYAREVVFNRIGRTRVMLDNNGDGIVEDAEGKPLSCAVATQG